MPCIASTARGCTDSAMSEQPLQFLPPKLREVAQVVGVEAAIRLAEHWPGIRLFVPQRVHIKHPIALAIGLTAAEKLAAHYGGETLTVPANTRFRRAMRNAQILAEYRAGASGSQLARKYGLHENHVYALVAQAAASQQPDLFAEDKASAQGK